MSKAAEYKQRAREYEQREDWERAIEAYEIALRAAKRSGDEFDLSLYNRIGDLYRRTGNVNKAVEHYEAAADAHMEAGFYNNAIALCNKILRSTPNRHSIYLKLGKIGAAKGFLSDARKHFLEYADRMQRANQLDAAFAALMEFAHISPDPEIRLMIADQLLEHDREQQAVEQLRLAWRDLRENGREADAEQVRSRIVEMSPDRDPEVNPPEEDASAGGLDAEGVIDLPEIEPYPSFGADEPEPEEPDVESLEIMPTTLSEEEPKQAEPEPDDIESLDIVPTSLDADIDAEDADDGVAHAVPEAEEDDDYSAELVDELSADLAEIMGGAEEEGEEPESGLEFADSIEFDEPEPAEATTQAPPSPEERASDLRQQLGEAGPEPALKAELADTLLEMGEREEATRELREALQLYDDRGEYSEANRIVDELVRLDRNDVHAYQKRVEMALKTGDRPALANAYLELADCLDRTEAGNKARIVYERVLELEPGNERAQAALELLGADEGPAVEELTATPEGERGEDYVDLGSLVLGDEEAPRSTRFQVPAAEPQSEDEVNFSEMLNQFKSKVSETIREEDVASHYDLGVAFKEMGLVDEAIAEFQIATRSEEFRLRAIEMLGACFLEKEEHRIALKVLNRAVQTERYSDEDLVGIFYAMGRAYEALGEQDQALESYERVMGCDIHFADVGQRVSALRS